MPCSAQKESNSLEKYSPSRSERNRLIFFGGSSGVLGDLLVGFSFLGGGTVGVGGHGDDEGDADVEEVDDRKRAVA